MLSERPATVAAAAQSGRDPRPFLLGTAAAAAALQVLPFLARYATDESVLGYLLVTLAPLVVCTLILLAVRRTRAGRHVLYALHFAMIAEVAIFAFMLLQHGTWREVDGVDVALTATAAVAAVVFAAWQIAAGARRFGIANGVLGVAATYCLVATALLALGFDVPAA